MIFDRHDQARRALEPAGEGASPSPGGGARVIVTGPQGPGCLIDIQEPGPAAKIRVAIEASAPLPNVSVRIGRIERGTLVVAIREGNAALLIGNSRLFNGRVTLCRDSSVTIGTATTVQHASIVARFGDVAIGEDCMIAGSVNIDASRHHSVIDLAGNKPMVIGERPYVRIGNHVWVGMFSLVLNHAQIGDGSIVGAASVATGRYPSRVAIGGNPARVLRENVTWSRLPEGIDEATSDFIAASPDYSEGQSRASSHSNTSI